MPSDLAFIVGIVLAVLGLALARFRGSGAAAGLAVAVTGSLFYFHPAGGFVTVEQLFSLLVLSVVLTCLDAMF